MTDDESFQKLGETLDKQGFNKDAYSVISELRPIVKNTIADYNTPLYCYINLFNGSICFTTVINDKTFLISCIKQSETSDLGKGQKELI